MKERKSKVLYAIVVMCALFALAKPVDVKAYDATIPYNGNNEVCLSDIIQSETPGDQLRNINVTDNGTLIVDVTKTIIGISINTNKTLTIKDRGNNKLTLQGAINGADGNLTIDGANLETESSIDARNIVIKERSNVKAQRITFFGRITIEGGIVDVDSSNTSYVNGAIFTNGGEGIFISGGTVTVKGGSAPSSDAGIYCSGAGAKIVISGGQVNVTGNFQGIYASDTIEIKGSNTVVKATAGTYAIQSGDGITIDAPLKIIKPDGGSISGNRLYIITKEGLDANDVEIRKAPDKKDDSGDSGSEEEPVKAAVINKNAIHILSMTGLPYGTFFAKQEQGLAAKHAFAAALPSGYKSAFTFNMITNGHKPDFTLKKGKFTIVIPPEYRKAGRIFALQALDKNGKVMFLPDKDTDPDTITVEVDLEGYAFELVYKD